MEIRNHYPRVRFDPASNLVYADDTGRIVTAGGTTSWHDLALHIIARHASPGDALHIAKVYLLKWHPEGQLPYTGLVRRAPHADSIAKRCETWLSEHFRDIDAIRQLLEQASADRGLAGSHLAGQQNEAATHADAVEQMGQGLLVALAHEEIARVRRDRKRFFV